MKVNELPSGRGQDCQNDIMKLRKVSVAFSALNNQLTTAQPLNFEWQLTAPTCMWKSTAILSFWCFYNVVWIGPYQMIVPIRLASIEEEGCAGDLFLTNRNVFYICYVH